MTRATNLHRKNTYRVALVGGPVLGLALVLGGCDAGSSSSPGSETGAPSTASASATADTAPETSDAEHPDVIGVVLKSGGNGTWSLDVTLSSAYDSPQRYADGWRVMDESGNVLGEHTLTHDHADEQPVTRTQSGLEIPDGVDVITVEGRDTENGFGGATLEVKVPR